MSEWIMKQAQRQQIERCSEATNEQAIFWRLGYEQALRDSIPQIVLDALERMEKTKRPA